MAYELSKYVDEINDAYNRAKHHDFKQTPRAMTIDFALELATKLKIADVSAEKLRSDAE